VRWLLRDRFPVVDHIARVTAPTIVIYGSTDTTVPPEQSRVVADHAALAVRVVVVDRADHNDPFSAASRQSMPSSTSP
jgi:pimeloyl-ACP methyl ester carboxylesterase